MSGAVPITLKGGDGAVDEGFGKDKGKKRMRAARDSSGDIGGMSAGISRRKKNPKAL